MRDGARPVANLLDDIPAQLAAERFDELLARPGVRIERIVSTGHVSPPGSWYDQDWDEWILLVQGAAMLEIEGRADCRLERGDHLLIPAHVRHRVGWTDPARSTVWLAVHIDRAG